MASGNNGANLQLAKTITISGEQIDLTTKSIEDQTFLIVARLMEGGQEDEETCRTLNDLTKLLGDDSLNAGREKAEPPVEKPLYTLIDSDGFETLLGYLDMRQPDTVRYHATLTIAAYFKACEEKGSTFLHNFFTTRLSQGTYDDLICAFSVASSIFPVLPELSAEFFLKEGFVQSIGPVMKKKWKSRKVERAALEMLNVACMNTACREAIQKHCTEWLEELIREHPVTVLDVSSPERHHIAEDGPVAQRIHSENIRNQAAVILAKIQAVLTSKPDPEERITPVTMDMDELCDIFVDALSTQGEGKKRNSIEGLAYASIQPKVKETLANDKEFLKDLVQAMKEFPAKSPPTYGALTILENMTRYIPVVSEEQKRMAQLKAYANASPATLQTDPLNEDAAVEKRCKAVFEAGVVPILVTHSQHGSTTSLKSVISIIHSIAKTPKIRGQIAQQGAVKLLLHAYSVFPESDTSSRRKTAHALALILISVNPAHVFGGSNPLPLVSAIRPLLLLLTDDPTTEQRNLLPTFESLLALANLCSVEDDAPRVLVVRLAWPSIEDLLLSSNPLITRATVELICNLVQAPEAVAKFGDGSKAASQRVHILLALADVENYETRRGAGGALASLTMWDTCVNAILERERGVKILLGLCKEEKEEMRHRGVVCVGNVVGMAGKVGEWGTEKVRSEGGVEVMKECLKLSRSQEVLEGAVEILKKIVVERKELEGVK